MLPVSILNECLKLLDLIWKRPRGAEVHCVHVTTQRDVACHFHRDLWQPEKSSVQTPEMKRLSNTHTLAGHGHHSRSSSFRLVQLSPSPPSVSPGLFLLSSSLLASSKPKRKLRYNWSGATLKVDAHNASFSSLALRRRSSRLNMQFTIQFN